MTSHSLPSTSPHTEKQSHGQDLKRDHSPSAPMDSEMLNSSPLTPELEQMPRHAHGPSSTWEHTPVLTTTTESLTIKTQSGNSTVESTSPICQAALAPCMDPLYGTEHDKFYILSFNSINLVINPYHFNLYLSTYHQPYL